MKLFKYNQFLGDNSINENLDKSKKYLKERYLLLTAAREADVLKGELAAQVQHKERRSVRLIDFTPEERDKIKAKLREITLTPEVVKSLERDESFQGVRTLKTTVQMAKGPKEFQLDRDNIGWLSNFTYFYYFEDISLEDLSMAYGKLLTNKDVLQNLTIDIDGRLTKKQFDQNYINEEVPNNFEKLTDALDRLAEGRKIKKMYDTLTTELKKSYDETSDANKEKFASIAYGFEQLGKKSDGTFDEVKKKQLWDGFFGQMSPDTRPFMPDGKTANPTFGKVVYQSTLKRYKNIYEFIVAANGYLASNEMDGFASFYELFQKCNAKLGAAGAEMVFNENGIFIIEVNSFAANQMLNQHTSHCIKDSMGYWNSYVDSHDNKQYYIYNFHVALRDNLSTIGITIEPGQIVRACHDRADRSMTADSFRAQLKRWQTEYKIDKDLWSYFLPMDNEEIRKRQKAKEANRKIVVPGISKEEIIEYVTEYNADINKENGACLVNAVKENDYEKVKLILQLGGLPNLTKDKEAPISYATNFNMVKLLLDFGSEMTGHVFKGIANDVDALHYCLHASGMDVTFNHNLPFRACNKGSYNEVTKDMGAPYMESFHILMKYIKSKMDLKTLLLDKSVLSKWAAEYHRHEILEYFEETGVYKEYSEKQWADLLKWASISRTPKENVKAQMSAATVKLIEDIRKRNS